MTILGEVFLNINGTSCSFQVVPDELPLPVDGIVGIPFLKDASIHLKEKQIYHPLGTFSFSPEQKKVTVHMNSRTKQLITLPVTNPDIKEGYLPIVNLGPGIYLGEVLVKVKENNVTLFCIITTTRKVQLTLPPLKLEEFEIINSNIKN